MLQSLIKNDNRGRNIDRDTEDWKWYEDPYTTRNSKTDGWNAVASIGKDTAPKPFPAYDPQPPVHF